MKMIKFNPEGKGALTYREAYGPATEITDPEEAAKYKEGLIEYRRRSMGPKATYRAAKELVEGDLRHYSGYFSDEVGARVLRLFVNV